VWVVTATEKVAARREPREAGWWSAEFPAADGEVYWLQVDDGEPLLDPGCLDLMMTPDGPRSVVRAPWASRPQGTPLTAPPAVYELHVKGFGRTYRGCIEHLDHVATLGANVIELMPVHSFDDRDNYWGYMPLVWSAVHRNYAEDPARAAEELAELVAAAHDRGIHVWIDVVFNHTGEDHTPTGAAGLRHLDPTVYRGVSRGQPTNDSGCGNDIEPGHPWVRELVIDALDRYADLGVDGFRFDLASLLTRDGGGLVTRITEWAETRGVVLISEPWDMGGYQLGRGWPWPTWLQWNDRFRDQVRGFVRGEPGLVRAMRQRVQGSPDLFGPDGAVRSLNFITAHDGLTMHDLTTVHSDRYHAWDCGPDMRLQQLQNYFAMLLLSAGTPMWVMGDEFGRTQQGHDNPYDLDGPLTWVDWSRRAEWPELTEFVTTLLGLRRRHPLVRYRFHGVGPTIDESYESRSLAWCVGDLYVMVNAWWQPLTFEVQQPGPWTVALATADPDHPAELEYCVGPRSIVVLERSES
jgi:glycogen operon protein